MCIFTDVKAIHRLRYMLLMFGSMISFCAVSCYVRKRNEDPRGDVSLDWVRDGNQICDARFNCFLLLL